MSSETRRIDEIRVYLAVDQDGNESIIGVKGPDGWMPMYCANKEQFESLTEAVGRTGMTIRVARFTIRDDNEEPAGGPKGERH